MPEPYEADYSGSDEERILAWVAELTKQPAIASEGQFADVLRDGVALCELANALRPGSVAQINRSTMPFPQRENIRAFIETARELGVDDRDNFDTSDLFEDKNLNQVRICLINLGRAAYHIDGYQGPCLGKPIAAGRSGGRHATVETTGLWGKAGGDFSTTDRGGGGRSRELPADEFRFADATSTEWKHEGPAAEGTTAAFAQEIASLAPSANLVERDDANMEGIDASSVAADHIAAELGVVGQSEWLPCMVKKGTLLQGMLQKLPSKRAGIHGWQRRFMTLKDKELRYYERMEDAAENQRNTLSGNYGKPYEVLFVKDIRGASKGAGSSSNENAIAEMPTTFETEEESATDSVHEFHVDTGQRVIYIRAESADQKLEWMKALNVKYTPPGLYPDEETQETPRADELATSAGVMAAEYCPCMIRKGAAAPQLRSKLSLKSLKKLGGWQERWMLLQGELLMAFETEAAMNNVVERANRHDSTAFHGANPAKCLVVHDVVAPPNASEADDKFEFHIDCEIVGKDERGMTVAGAGTHRLFLVRARNIMEKQRWLHTLNPARFSDVPPEGIPEGRSKGGMGIVGGAYRALDEVKGGQGMDERLAQEEAERAAEALRHDTSGALSAVERGARVGYENPKSIRGVKHNFSESQWQGVEAYQSDGRKALTLDDRLAAKEEDRLARQAEKQKALEEEAARKARSEEAKKDFLAKKREELERTKAIQAAIAASRQEVEPKLQLEPEPERMEEEWQPPPPPEPEPVRMAGIAGRFPDEVAALEQAARSNPDNLVAQVFEADVLNMMGSAKAQELLKALAVGFEHSDVCGQQREAVGCFISAAEDYRMLQPYMDQLIRTYFGIPSVDNGDVPLHVGPDTVVRGGTRPSWEVNGVLPIEVKTAGPKCGARLRFNRNLKGPGFKLLAGYGDDPAARKELEVTLSTAVKEAFAVGTEDSGGKVIGGRYYSLTVGHNDFVTESELSALRQANDGMAIPELVDPKFEPQAEILKLGGVLGCWPEGRGFWLAEDRSVSVWIGGYEHISLLVSGTCKVNEGGLAALLNTGKGLLERLRIAIVGEGGAWASHSEYGFVSTHPPNLGTGLRAVARIAVPTLSKRGKDLSSLSRAVAMCGLAAGSQGGERFAGMEQLPRDGKCEVWRVVGMDANKHEGDEGDAEGDETVPKTSTSPSFGLTEADAVEELWAAVENLLGMEAKAKAVSAAASRFY